MNLHFKPNNEFIKENRLVFFAVPEAPGEAMPSQAEMAKEATQLMEEFAKTELADNDLKTLDLHKQKSNMILQKLAKINGFAMPNQPEINFPYRRYYARQMLEKKHGASETVTKALDQAEGKEVKAGTEQQVATAETKGKGFFEKFTDLFKPKELTPEQISQINSKAQEYVQEYRNYVGDARGEALNAKIKEIFEKHDVETPAIQAGASLEGTFASGRLLKEYGNPGLNSPESKTIAMAVDEAKSMPVARGGEVAIRR